MLNGFLTRNASQTSSMSGLNPNQLLKVSSQSITPTNPGDLQEVRTCKVEQQYRPVSKNEADNARIEAAKAQAQAKVNAQYYKALARHERADAKSQASYRQYQSAQAGATFQKVKANANLGKTLYNLAPQYAKTHMSLGSAGEEAAVRFAEYQATYQQNQR